MTGPRASLRYDPETGLFLRGSRILTARSTLGYRYLKFDGRTMPAHRVAWYLHFGRWPFADIDHINGERGDNRIVNLREATRSQNLANKVCRNKTGFKGVFVHRDSRRKKRFGAQWCKDGKYHFGGWYETAAEAAEAYKRGAVAAHGEFAQWDRGSRASA